MEIYRPDGTVIIDVVVTKDCEHVEELMKSDYVRMSWVDEEHYVIPAGSYIMPFDASGAVSEEPDRYTIYEDYVPEETVNGFRYQPEFKSPVMWLSYVPFVFSTKDASGNDVSKTEHQYVGRLSEILEYVCSFINDAYGFTNPDLKFIVSPVGLDLEQTVSVSFSDNDVLSALSAIAEAANCEYYLDWAYRNLFFGTMVFGDRPYMLKVGENVNEPTVNRSSKQLYNRYIVLGSTRNIVRRTENGYLATGERLTLPAEYPDSIIDLRTDTNVPPTTGIMRFDDIYPHLDLYLYDVHERRKYRVDENGYNTSEQWSVWYFKLAYPTVRDASGNITEWADYELKSSPLDKVRAVIEGSETDTYKDENALQTVLEYKKRVFPNDEVVISAGGRQFTVNVSDTYRQSFDKELAGYCSVTIIDASADNRNALQTNIPNSMNAFDSVVSVLVNGETYSMTVASTYRKDGRTSGEYVCLIPANTVDFTAIKNGLRDSDDSHIDILSGIEDIGSYPFKRYVKTGTTYADTGGYACLIPQSEDDFAALRSLLSVGSAVIYVSGVNADALPKANITSRMVDGLVPTIAFRINDRNAEASRLGTREFEVEYHSSAVDFDAKDDVDGQHGIGPGYYEIIHTEEGDDNLILPSTSEKGLCPYGFSVPSNMNSKAFLFNIAFDPDGEEVASARSELLTEARNAVAELNTDYNTYTFQLNPVVMENSPNIEYYIGRKVEFELSGGYRLTSRILSITTKLDYDFCKTITVGNEVSKGMYSQLKSALEGKVATTIAGSIGSGSGNTADYSDSYISKEYEDETEFLVSFFGGIIVDQMLKSPNFSKSIINGENILGGRGFSVEKSSDGTWRIELDYATIRRLIRAKEIIASKAAIDTMTKQTAFNLGLKTLGDILIGDYESGKNGGIITADGDAELRNLMTRLQATIGSGIHPDESDTELRKPSLIVNGDSEFSDNLSSPEFVSGYFSGKGWAIQKQTIINSAGEEETKWVMEIDNLTVRSVLRVYELVVSQLRGENDNYVFAAMMEVDHYDPATGKVWLSTEGGKIYMPFRVGDYILVQHFQPGNDVVSGGDGYITKQYELIVIAVGTGGEGDPKDANGDRLDWVQFKNFTTQMVNDRPNSTSEDYVGTYYSEDDISQMGNPTFMTAEKLITKGDTFCRVDNETDPERKGLMTITSVGPNTPYMDVIYGMKTDPEHKLKSRIGNLEGIHTDQFGWLEGFGAYINNLYSIGMFFNKQTGESMESRIEATNERMRSVYKETLFDVSDADNKVTNGFFQDDLEGWTPTDETGKDLADSPEMEYRNNRWNIDNATTDNDKEEVQVLKSGIKDDNGNDLPLLMNGLQLQVKKTLRVEMANVGGVRMLHLYKSGVSQNFSAKDSSGRYIMYENTSHKKLTVDSDEFDNPKNENNHQPEYEKTTYSYWEEYYRDWLKDNYDYEDWKIEEILRGQTAINWINNQVAMWSASCETQENRLTSTEEEPDKLYIGIRILPLTSGYLRVGFLTQNGVFDQYGNSQQCFTKYFTGAGNSMKWEFASWNDNPEEGMTWFFPCDMDEQRKKGRLFIGYTGECYIRFVALTNDPIEEAEHEYETLFEQNSRRIRMQASKDKEQFADWVIQHNAIVQRVTDNKEKADHALEDILGIKQNSDGTYTFPDNWVDDKYTYASWIIHTKNRMDFLFERWDDDDNLVAYSNRTQTADYIKQVIAGDIDADTRALWGERATSDLEDAFDNFKQAWADSLEDGTIDARERAYLRSLQKTMQEQYTSVKAEYDKFLENQLLEDGDKTSLGNIWSAFNTSYNNLNAAINEVLGLDLVEINANGTYKNAVKNVSTAFTAFDTALKNLHEALRTKGNVLDDRLASLIKTVDTNLTNYQKSLDEAVQAIYPDNPNYKFINWLNDTKASSIHLLALLSVDEYNQPYLPAYSTRIQTAKDISDAVEQVSWQKIDLSDMEMWEQGTTTDGNTAKTYDEIKANSSTRIRIKVPLAMTSYPANQSYFILNNGYKLALTYFGSDGKRLGYTSWLTPDWSSQGAIGKVSFTPHTNVRNAAVVICRSNGQSISPSQVSSTGIKAVIHTVNAASYVTQTAEKIMSNVTTNKQDSDDAWYNLKGILGISSWENGLGEDKTFASWIEQTAGNITSVATEINNKIISLSDPNNWERQATSGTTAGMSYESITFKSSTARITYKTLIPITKTSKFYINNGYQFVGIFFNSNKVTCSPNCVTGDSNNHFLPNEVGGSTDMTVPSDAAYVLISVRKFGQSGNITPSEIAASGLALVDSKIASISYVEQTAENIMTTVKDYKTNGYSIITQTADAIKSVVTGNYIGDKISISDYAKNSDLPDMSKYYLKTQIDQLASSITSRVTGLERQVIDLNNIDNWEQGFIGNTAGSTYDNLKQDNANFIRTKALLGISQDTVFTISDSFVMMLAFFNYSRNLISRTVALTKTGDVIAPQIPSNATYCAITISKSGYATSVLDLPSAKLFKIDSSVVTSAEISAFVSKDSNGYLESGIKLRADQISITTIDQFGSDFNWNTMANKLKGKITIAAKDLLFDANNIAWTLLSNWTIRHPVNNSTEDVLKFTASSGNLWVKGTINVDLQYGKVIYLDSGNYSINLTLNPAKVYVDASDPYSGPANVYLPNVSSCDGVELQFYVPRPKTRTPLSGGITLNTQTNESIVCQDTSVNYLRQKEVSTYSIRLGVLVTVKSMAGSWYIVTGDNEP